jgi:hypothetical protein
VSGIRPPQTSGSLALFALVSLAAGCQHGGDSSLPRPSETPPAKAGSTAAASPESASYRIGGRVVALHDGKHEEPAAPGSAARNTTIVWGTPLAADLDGDGDQDAVVIIESRPGGSGTFYYIAAAALDRGSYIGSSAVFLGDRIAPQGVTFASGVVTVDFAERRTGEPMSTPPSVGVSRRFVYRDGQLRPLGAGEMGFARP